MKFLNNILILLATTWLYTPKAIAVAKTELTIPPRLSSSQYKQLPKEQKPIKLVLRLKQRRLYLYKNNKVEDIYQVAIGRKGWETPTGTFKVINMITYPVWEHPLNGQIIPPGPNNPLGKRWIGFLMKGQNQIGFHGTDQENLIGQAVSHGCVRMKNKDIINLFDKIEIGTIVEVEP